MSKGQFHMILVPTQASRAISALQTLFHKRFYLNLWQQAANTNQHHNRGPKG